MVDAPVVSAPIMLLRFLLAVLRGHFFPCFVFLLLDLVGIVLLVLAFALLFLLIFAFGSLRKLGVELEL